LDDPENLGRRFRDFWEKEVSMISMNVNGKKYDLTVSPDTPLLWVLRETLGLTGTKYGCGISGCGSCTVHVEGEPIRSCGVPVSSVEGKKITTMITSRGCPYRCIFCDKSIFGSKWRARSAKNVLDEMEQIVKDLRIPSIIIYDDLFTLDKQRVQEICQGILERDLRFEWKCEGRVDRVDGEMLRWMKKAGCSLVAYGVESGNEIGLDYLQKGITLPQIRRAFELTRQAGIRPMAYFILGIPVETFDQGLRTIAFAKELDPDYAQFSILSPYRGTRLYEEARAKGWYAEVEANNPFDKDQTRPVLLSKNWSGENLKEILRLAHKEFYFRPGYILKRLRGIRDLHQMRSLAGVGCGLLRWYLSKGASR
jgi:radical SAM superfamily enzyme YgiQ (UPF0313 family)